MNVRLRIVMKSSEHWLVSMQCVDLAAGLACIVLISAVLRQAKYSRATYKLTPAKETRGGQRHELRITLRGDPARPEEVRKFLVESMPPIAEMAGRQKKATETNRQTPEDASQPERPLDEPTSS